MPCPPRNLLKWKCKEATMRTRMVALTAGLFVALPGVALAAEQAGSGDLLVAVNTLTGVRRSITTENIVTEAPQRRILRD